jgi:prepilin-type N-terminal cleavage/methylation domain-containing protein
MMKNTCLQRGGFTLIEILIAISIFGFIIAIIYPSFRTIATSAGYLKTEADEYDMAMTCLARMSEDLTSLYIKQKPEYKKPDFDSEGDQFRFSLEKEYVDNEELPLLRFTSLSHLATGRNKTDGVAAIVYYCSKEESGSLNVFRYDTLDSEKKFERRKNDPVLIKGLKHIEFACYDSAGERHEIWDSESDESGYATPTSVEIILTTGDEKRSQKVQTRVALPCFREKSD